MLFGSHCFLFSFLLSPLIPINCIIGPLSNFLLSLVVTKAQAVWIESVLVSVLEKITQFFFNRTVMNLFCFGLRFLE